jgi:NAD(P)-dependent dehydrogenase (short-subunit alcohol dehydrogenase family)
MSARTIIVTGGFGILGQAVAVAFAAQGDRVARVDFAKTPPKITAALDIGGADVTSPDVAEDVVAEVTTKLGPPPRCW